MDHAAVTFLHVSTSWRCDWPLDCHNRKPSVSTYQVWRSVWWRSVWWRSLWTTAEAEAANDVWPVQ